MSEDDTYLTRCYTEEFPVSIWIWDAKTQKYLGKVELDDNDEECTWTPVYASKEVKYLPINWAVEKLKNYLKTENKYKTHE